MYILFFVLGLTTFLIVAVFNAYLLILGVKNCLRIDGSISKKRVLIEIDRFVRYFETIFFVVLLLVFMVYLSVFLVHTYIIPINIVEDSFSLFEFDAVAWKEAIKDDLKGGLDQQYEDWGVKQGYSKNVIKSLAKVFLQYWFPLLIILFILVVVVYFVQIKVLAGITKHYYERALLRRQAYYRVDLKRTRKWDPA